MYQSPLAGCCVHRIIIAVIQRGTCRGPDGQSLAAPAGAPGTCCGVINAQPFCCPVTASCYNVSDREYRCRTKQSEQLAASGSTKESASGPAAAPSPAAGGRLSAAIASGPAGGGAACAAPSALQRTAGTYFDHALAIAGVQTRTPGLLGTLLTCARSVLSISLSVVSTQCWRA